MKELKFVDNSKNGYFNLTVGGDWEYVHPLEKIGEMFITSSMNFTINHANFLKENNQLPSDDGVRYPNVIIERVARKQALKDWGEELKNIQTTVIPDNLMDILSASKKQQLKILKGLTLTTQQYIAFIVKTWDYGYTYSNYHIELPQAGLNLTQMPALAYKEQDGSVSTIGNTSLSQGQLRNAIDHRSVRVAKFFDNGTSWHCFFLTYKSIGGMEAYKGGAHIHFISHTWNLTRDYVLNQLRSRDYKLPAAHVSYKTERDHSEET